MNKRILVLALLLAISLPYMLPVSAYAMNWVLPSGAVVNDAGQLISGPTVASFTVKPGTTTLTTLVPKMCLGGIPKTAIDRFFYAITCSKK